MTASEQWPQRTVEVVLHTTIQSIGTTDIDEKDYLEWLDGKPDTLEAVQEYIEAGESWEIEADVWQQAQGSGRHEVWDSEISEIRTPKDATP